MAAPKEAPPPMTAPMSAAIALRRGGSMCIAPFSLSDTLAAVFRRYLANGARRTSWPAYQTVGAALLTGGLGYAWVRAQVMSGRQRKAPALPPARPRGGAPQSETRRRTTPAGRPA